MDGIEALFMSELLRAQWFDAKHNPIPPCSADEAWAFSQRVVENLLRAAETKEAFLINLSALAGGQILLHKGSLRVTRLEELPDRTRYSCSWELRYGDIIGSWSMEETVMHDAWKKKKKRKHGEDDVADSGTGTGTASHGTAAAPPDGGGGGSQADYWERKYKELAVTLQKREEEMRRFKAKVIELIREF